MALIDNIIANYHMNEASGDIIDNVGSNDLTNNGAAYGGTGHIAGQDALTFDGGTDYLSGSFSKTFNAWTIAIWVKSTATPDTWGGLINFDVTDLLFRRFSTNNTVNYQSSAGSILVNSTDDIVDGSWHLVVGTWDGSTAELWIDNVSQGTDASTGSSVTISTMEVGRSEQNNSFSWKGELQEANIWDVKKSDADLTELWNSGAGVSFPFVSAVQKTSTGNSRIEVADNQITKTGTSRIQIDDTEEVYDSDARIEVPFKKTSIGDSRIEVADNQKTSTGNASIDFQFQKTSNGDARIEITDNQITKTGNAFISTLKEITYTGNATIEVLDTQKTSDGDARIEVQFQKTSNGDARINIQSQVDKTGDARIEVADNQITKTGNARIEIQQSIQKTGDARIEVQDIQIQKTGNAFIFTGKQITYPGNAFISVVDEFKPVVNAINSTKPTFRSAETFN